MTQSRSPRRSPLGLFLRNPTGIAGLSILLLVIVAALLAPWLFPDDPLDMVTRPFLWPLTDHAFPLGSDSLGRDVLAGVMHGARVSVVIGVAATAIGLLIGTTIGAAAGYFGGWVDDVLVRVMEVFQTFPPFLLVVVLVSIAEPSVLTITLAIGIVSWTTIARLVRADLEPAAFVAMKAAGCVGFNVGVESGSDRILEKMRKGTTVHMVQDFFRFARPGRDRTAYRHAGGR